MIAGMTMRHTIIRERPKMVPDGRGSEVADFTESEPVDIPGWGLDSGATVADLQNRDGAEVTWTARGPYLADVKRHDRITVMGIKYRIEGDVRRQPGPSPLTSHTILALSSWDG